MTLSHNEEGNVVISEVVSEEAPPLDDTQVAYIRYLDRRREIAEKHPREAPPVNFETFKVMVDDFFHTDNVKVCQAIAKLLYAEQDDGLLRIRKDT